MLHDGHGSILPRHRRAVLHRSFEREDLTADQEVVRRKLKHGDVSIDLTDWHYRSEHLRSSTFLQEEDREIAEAIATAFAAIWKKHVGTETQAKVKLVVAFTDAAGNLLHNHLGGYDPETDEVSMNFFAIKIEIRGLTDEQKIFLVSAHEFTHRVQAARGEKLTPSLADPNYDSNPHEQEAWRESLDLLKAAFPDLTGSFTLGGVRYDIPESSTYGPVLDELANPH